MPQISIEEFYSALVKITEFDERNASALGLLIERVCEKSFECGLDLCVNPHTIHR